MSDWKPDYRDFPFTVKTGTLVNQPELCASRGYHWFTGPARRRTCQYCGVKPCRTCGGSGGNYDDRCDHCSGTGVER